MTKKGGRNIPTTTSKKVKYYDSPYQSEYWEALKNNEDTATLSVMVRIAIVAIALSILVNSLS